MKVYGIERMTANGWTTVMWDGPAPAGCKIAPKTGRRGQVENWIAGYRQRETGTKFRMVVVAK